jgi:hypothetical protein
MLLLETVQASVTEPITKHRDNGDSCETYRCTHRGCPGRRTNTRRPCVRRSPPLAHPLARAIPVALGTISLQKRTTVITNKLAICHKYFALILTGIPKYCREHIKARSCKEDLTSVDRYLWFQLWVTSKNTWT